MWNLAIHDTDNETEPFIIYGQDERGEIAIATVHAFPEDESSEGITLEQAEANARLIAAAPEMLEALKMIWENAFDRDETYDYENNELFEEFQIIKNAIEKATGETL